MHGYGNAEQNCNNFSYKHGSKGSYLKLRTVGHVTRATTGTFHVKRLTEIAISGQSELF